MRDQPMDFILQQTQTAPLFGNISWGSHHERALSLKHKYNGGGITSVGFQGSQSTITLFTTSSTYSLFFFYPGEAEPWGAT